jgi:hypothetical protein
MANCSISCVVYTLGSNKVGFVFRLCEVGPRNNVLSLMEQHAIIVWLNSLINLLGRRLALNIWDVIRIWTRDREIISPLSRGAKTINWCIVAICGHSCRTQPAIVYILDDKWREIAFVHDLLGERKVRSYQLLSWYPKIRTKSILHAKDLWT